LSNDYKHIVKPLKRKNMRTLSSILFATALFVFFTSQGFSQTSSTPDVQKKDVTTGVTPGKFVDSNKNGVCDNFEARGTNGKGANFVDKNGDGKCDNRQNAANCKVKGNCCGKEKGMGCNQGKGNGGCCGRGSGNGYGQGHQHRNGWQNQKATPATDQPSGNQKN
jgi:hypothetical protein